MQPVEKRICRTNYRSRICLSGTKTAIFFDIKANSLVISVGCGRSKAMYALMNQETLSLGKMLERQLRRIAKKSRKKAPLILVSKLALEETKFISVLILVMDDGATYC